MVMDGVYADRLAVPARVPALTMTLPPWATNPESCKALTADLDTDVLNIAAVAGSVPLEVLGV